jgi:MFS family permease
MGLLDYERHDIIKILCILCFVNVAQLGYATIMFAYVPMLMGHPYWLDFASPQEVPIYTNIALCLYPLGQFFGSPIVGRAGDTLGRRPVLLLSLIMAIVAIMGICVSILHKDFWALCGFTFASGLAESTYAIASTMLADIESDPTKQQVLYSYMGFAVSGAYIIGPLLCLLQKFDEVYPFLALGAAMLLVLCFCFFFVEETYMGDLKETKTPGLCEHLCTFLETCSDEIRRPVYFGNWACYMTTSGIFRSIPLYILQVYELNDDDIQYYLVAIGAWSSLIFSWFVPFAVARYIPQNNVLFSTSSLSLLLAALVYMPSIYWHFFMYCLCNLPMCVLLAVLPSRLACITTGPAMGKVMGINASLMLLSEFMASLISGYIAAQNSAWGLLCWAIWAGVAFLLLLALPSRSTPPKGDYGSLDASTAHEQARTESEMMLATGASRVKALDTYTRGHDIDDELLA